MVVPPCAAPGAAPRAAGGWVGLIRASAVEGKWEKAAGKRVQVRAEYGVARNAALGGLYPGGKHVLPRMRALHDFLAHWFRDAGNIGRVPAVG